MLNGIARQTVSKKSTVYLLRFLFKHSSVPLNANTCWPATTSLRILWIGCMWDSGSWVQNVKIWHFGVCNRCYLASSYNPQAIRDSNHLTDCESSTDSISVISTRVVQRMMQNGDDIFPSTRGQKIIVYNYTSNQAPQFLLIIPMACNCLTTFFFKYVEHDFPHESPSTGGWLPLLCRVCWDVPLIDSR